MKATGIVRKIDNLGRIVVPKELRETMEIDKKDPMEIYVDGMDQIVLQKYEPACVFCGDKENTLEFNDKTICQSCVDNMKEKAE